MSKSSQSVSEIDRLIELASADAVPAAGKETSPLTLVGGHASSDAPLSPSGKGRKESETPMWRVLLQLRVLLPYLARLLPLVERSLLGTNITGHSAAKVDTSQLEQAIASIQAAQRDLAAQLKGQAGSVEYLQEQLTWLGKSLEKQMAKEEETLAEVIALKKRVSIWAVVLVVLLVALIGLVTFSLLHRVG